MRFVILLLLVLSITACIYLPKYEPEPYKLEVLAQIKPNETTREEVIELLGNPTISREDNGIWLYYYNRELGYIILVFPAGGGQVVDPQFVLLEFHQDTVSYVELVEDFETSRGCSNSGVCLYISDWETGTLEVTSRRKDDQEAKLFEPDSEKCGLYVVTYHSQVYISVNSYKDVSISEFSYLYKLLPPGTHEISFSSSSLGTLGSNTMQVECVARSLVFVEIYGEMEKYFPFPKAALGIRVAEDERIREVILDKNVIMLPH
jgi:outer membrane protein assembly factor BamE (lipoprotein component of BamABCDE complex)